MFDAYNERTCTIKTKRHNTYLDISLFPIFAD